MSQSVLKRKSDSSTAEPDSAPANKPLPESDTWKTIAKYVGDLPGWLISTMFHTLLLLVLAFLTLPHSKQEILQLISLQADQTVEALDEFELEEFAPDDQPEEQLQTLETESTPDDINALVNAPDLMANFDATPAELVGSDFSELMNPAENLIGGAMITADTALGGRAGKSRSAMVRRFGGSRESEEAVALALQWLADHQLPDGSWNFNHQMGPGRHRNSPNPGSAQTARNGATALALLPFLGAGQTHREGKHRRVVQKGLGFLVRHQQPVNQGVGSFHEPGGNMYSHGLCAIALTEAYAMTQDRQLAGPAQASLNFIVAAQDPIGGGWRYEPRQPGDTSVVGWQLMALKSGHMAKLKVPAEAMQGAIKFLNSVQSESGSRYGYDGPGGGSATTAIGLLSRMYLGWKRTHVPLQRGVEYLDELGPSIDRSADMYYNYYATQVMRHYGGKSWNKWNDQMRDWLVKTQAKEGNRKGSWYFPHPWAESGGRVYCTAMAAMILEVYYRHMPIYGQNAADEEFPL